MTTHPAPQLALIDQAFEAEIVKVSTVEYNSNAICRKFYEELRKRIEDNYSTQSRPEAELPEVTDEMVERALAAHDGYGTHADRMRRALQAAYGQQCAATRPAEVGGAVRASDLELIVAQMREEGSRAFDYYAQRISNLCTPAPGSEVKS